jgi:carbon-monoxide dehydrogenase iron sulfur subunit
MAKTMEKRAAKSKGEGKAIICRIDRCLGCRACEIACALVHAKSQDIFKAVQEDPKPRRRVNVESAGDRGLPLQCRHCENAPCIMVCPTEAMHRDSERGPVLIDEERCIGCKLCMVVCPFGAIAASADGKAVLKCDLCQKRLAAGEEPACVSACLTHALQFVDVEEHGRKKRKAAAERIRAESEADK